MTALASTDVTLGIIKRKTVSGFGRIQLVSLAFGNGSKTYPANGVPLPAVSAFGLPLSDLWDLQIVEHPLDGYVYKYDKTHHTIRIFQNGGFTPPGTITIDSHSHDLRIIGGKTAAEPVAVDTDTVTLGKAAATNRVIAGADQATKGGVVPVVATASVSGSSVAAGPLVELGAVAVAATTMVVRVEGK